jgi:hypothetical protein
MKMIYQNENDDYVERERDKDTTFKIDLFAIIFFLTNRWSLSNNRSWNVVGKLYDTLSLFEIFLRTTIFRRNSSVFSYMIHLLFLQENNEFYVVLVCSSSFFPFLLNAYQLCSVLIRIINSNSIICMKE